MSTPPALRVTGIPCRAQLRVFWVADPLAGHAYGP